MKKFLALVLTLAMVLTLNVGMIASAAADAPLVDVTGKATVTVDGVEYTVISDLAAVSTKGSYILSGDVAVANDAVITIAAGTVLNGNGYSITVDGNDLTAPLAAAPFELAAGEEIVITNVSFGNFDAPICLRSELPVDGDPADLSIFANDDAPQVDIDGNLMLDEFVPVVATFENVNFNVIASDTLNVNVAAVMAVANGDYTFANCSVACDFNVGDMAAGNGTDLTAGYVGGYFGQVAATGMVSFEACETAVGSRIINDYRTGGFVGGMAGGFSLVDCVNNATIQNRTLVTGGFIGWVEGETLSAWTLDGCVNNGDITAYMGPKDSADKNHGDNGRSAAAMIGYIYKDADNSAPQPIVTNCVNNGNIYGEDRLSGMMGDSRINYFTYTADDGTKTYGKNTMIMENCVNTGDVVCIVQDANSSAHVLGGMLSRTQGPTHFLGCVNYGRIDANGMDDGHLGGMVGNTSASQGAINNAVDPLVFEFCFNYGAIMNGRRIGGLIGASESETVMTNCVNYGSIASGTSSRADNFAGGLIGFADQDTHTITGCINLGTVNATKDAGGIVANSRNKNDSQVIITDCLNAGNITCADGVAGGIMGTSQAPVEIYGSMNVGKITATNSYVVSQILGMGEATVAIGNCYAFGSIDADAFVPNLDGALGFLCFAEVVVPDGSFMVKTIGAAADLVDARNLAVTAEEALAELKTLFGEDAPMYVLDGVIEYIEPAIRGVQTALEAADGATAVRFTGIVDDMGYDKVEFTYTVNGGEATTVTAVQLLDVKATNQSGNVETRDAMMVGGAELHTVTIEGVATTGEVVIEVTMTATANGVAYTSYTVTVTLVDGVIVG